MQRARPRPRASQPIRTPGAVHATAAAGVAVRWIRDTVRRLAVVRVRRRGFVSLVRRKRTEGLACSLLHSQWTADGWLLVLRRLWIWCRGKTGSLAETQSVPSRCLVRRQLTGFLNAASQPERPSGVVLDLCPCLAEFSSGCDSKCCGSVGRSMRADWRAISVHARCSSFRIIPAKLV